GTLRWSTTKLRIKTARRDLEQAAHRSHWIIALVRGHESEEPLGIVPVSRANQAVAFDKISRSSLSWRFSRRSFRSSSRSSVVRTSSRLPASASARSTHARIDCALHLNSFARSSGLRPARTRSTMVFLNSRGYGGWVLPMTDSYDPKVGRCPPNGGNST